MRAVLYRTRVACVVAGIALPLVLSGQSQDAVDARFRASIDPANIRENMRRLTARPHHVGSPYDKDNAEWMLARFREWGWEAEIETFDVLFPTPKERILEMIAPRRFRAALNEPPVAGDITSTQSDEQLATYNAYSKDGDVTAPLVCCAWHHHAHGEAAAYDCRTRRTSEELRASQGAIIVTPSQKKKYRGGGGWG